MSPPHRVIVNIPANRKIEIDVPGSLPIVPAEVVVIPQIVRLQRNRASGIDAGRLWIAEDFDAPLPNDVVAELRLS